MNSEIPSIVEYSNVEDLDRFDERSAAIDCLFVNIIGVNENTIEWCPNTEPASEDEKSAWLWLLKPSIGQSLLPDCSSELGTLIKAYESETMEKWFEYMAT